MEIIDAEVHSGDDGWLFLVGGSNSVLKLFQSSELVDDSKLNSWSRVLLERERRASELSAEYFHIVIPEKLTLYSEMYGVEGINFANSALNRHYQNAKDAGFHNLIDCFTPMNRQKRFRPLYYKTDTHWNYFGCLVAYLEICRMTGAVPVEQVFANTFQRVMLVLDLGAKLPKPIQEEFRVYNFARNSRRSYANGIVEYKELNSKENDAGLHVGSHVTFRNDAASADARSMVLFGDSFSEYRRHLLTGMLAETFRELHFIWSKSIDWGYVAQVRPDIILTESAERFLSVAPDDHFSVEKYTAAKMKLLNAAA